MFTPGLWRAPVGQRGRGLPGERLPVPPSATSAVHLSADSPSIEPSMCASSLVSLGLNDLTRIH